MSRIGKQPIEIADKTTVTYKNRVIVVKGEKGTLKREIHPACDLKIDEKNSIAYLQIKENAIFCHLKYFVRT